VVKSRTLPEGDWHRKVREEWDSWWTASGIGWSWSDAQVAAAERMLVTLEDFYACVGIAERRRLSTQLHRERKALGLTRPPTTRPSKRDRRRPRAPRPEPREVTPAVFPSDVEAGGDEVMARYCIDMERKHGPRWPEMSRGEIPWRDAKPDELRPELRPGAPNPMGGLMATLTAQDVARAVREESDRAAREGAAQEGRRALGDWLRHRSGVDARQQDALGRDAATGQFTSGGGLDGGSRGEAAPPETDKDTERRHINNWLRGRGSDELEDE